MRLSVIAAFDLFNRRKDISVQLVNKAHREDSRGRYILSAEQRRAITEYAFLRLFIAWEAFIEESFLKYSVGVASCRGNIVIRILNPQSEEHAYSIIRGGKAFIEWSNVDIIRPAAKLIFHDGGPFETPLSSILQSINEAKTIRNSIAHISRTTQPKLEHLALTKLGIVRNGITPYEVVYKSTASGIVFTDYASTFEAAATDIAHF